MTNKTILVIEDEPDHLEIIKLILEQNDCQVISMGNGLEALKYLHEHKPNLIICDVMLPGMNGLDVCKTVKQDPGLAKIPVIMLSVRADPRDKSRGLEVGASAYITKPFNLETLIEKVKELTQNE